MRVFLTFVKHLIVVLCEGFLPWQVFVIGEVLYLCYMFGVMKEISLDLFNALPVLHVQLQLFTLLPGDLQLNPFWE